MFNRNKAGILQENLLFSKVDVKKLKVRYHQKEVLSFREGSVVFQRGDETDFIYLIIEGEVKVKIIDKKYPVIISYKKNDFFGEKEIIEKTYRVSSAVAEIDTLIYPIKKSLVIEYISKDKKFLENLSRQYKSTSSNSSDEPASKGQEDFIDRSFIYPEPKNPDEMGEVPDLNFDDLKVEFPELTIEEETPDISPPQEVISDNIDEVIIPQEDTKLKDDINLADIDMTKDIKEDKTTLDEDFFKKLDEIDYNLDADGLSKLEEELNKQGKDIIDFDNILSEEIEENPIDSLDIDISLNKSEPEKFSFDSPDDIAKSLHDEGIIPEENKNIPEEEIKFSLDDYLKSNDDVDIVEESETPEKFTLDDISDKLEEELNIKDKLAPEEPAILFEDDEEENKNIPIEPLFEDDFVGAEEEFFSPFKEGIDENEINEETPVNEEKLFEDSDFMLNEFDKPVEDLFESDIDESGKVSDRDEKNKPQEKLFEEDEFSLDKPVEKLFEDEDMFGTSVENELNKQDWNFPEEKIYPDDLADIIKDEEIHQLSYTELRERLKDLNFMANYFLEDLSGPIEIINSSAKFLMNNEELPDDVKNAISLIIEQANRITDSIKTTIDFTESKQNLSLKYSSLNNVLDNILVNLAEYTENFNIKLYKKFDETAQLNLDQNKIYQAFYQLIKYACKAVGNDGKLYFTTRKEGNTVMIELRMHNYFIPDEKMESLFEPFGTEKLGFGLALAQKIFEEHGAFLKVEKKETKGTIFKILFFI